jgi:hypothetical protein
MRADPLDSLRSLVTFPGAPLCEAEIREAVEFILRLYGYGASPRHA